METLHQFTFDNAPVSPEAIFVNSFLELSEALESIGLEGSRPVLVLVGGASNIGAAKLAGLQQIFVEVLAPLAEKLGAVVIDGATDAGVMQLIGRAREQTNSNFPLIGVAAIGTVILPNAAVASQHGAPLEPHHTHFVFVPGSNWGDESPWMARVATVLAEGTNSITLVVNGGEITWRDVACSVSAGRPAIALAGSGRTADRLAAAVLGEPADERGIALAATGLVRAIDIEADFDVIARAIALAMTETLKG